MKRKGRKNKEVFFTMPNFISFNHPCLFCFYLFVYSPFRFWHTRDILMFLCILEIRAARIHLPQPPIRQQSEVCFPTRSLLSLSQLFRDKIYSTKFPLTYSQCPGKIFWIVAVRACEQCLCAASERRRWCLSFSCSCWPTPSANAVLKFVASKTRSKNPDFSLNWVIQRWCLQNLAIPLPIVNQLYNVYIQSGNLILRQKGYSKDAILSGHNVSVASVAT